MLRIGGGVPLVFTEPGGRPLLHSELHAGQDNLSTLIESRPTRSRSSELPQVLVEDRPLDLPASAKPHMWDRVLDDRLAQRRPGHPDMLRCFLPG